MMKLRELTDKDSCLNKAANDEMLFVLLGRDVCAPAVIRFWASERVRVGKNLPIDAQIVEALFCALKMEQERA